ncbi:MAG: hypothetical protein Q8R24_08910 [Legionellaceae bacterium]|nr:hypothetical protein [Legionellaceae bacterium]
MELKKQPVFYFIVVVWGDDYVDMLLQISLRCFLSPQNIPGLNNLNESRFIFVTTTDDFSRISASPMFKKLESYVQPVFLELDMSGDETIHTRMTMGYEQASKFSYAQKAYAIYLLPDCIISDGTFLSLERYALGDNDVVLVPGPRVIKEKFMSYVNDMNLKDDDVLALQSRKLADIGIDCLHTEFKNYNYTGKSFTKWPQMVSWNVPKQKGLLIRGFHLHPLMVNFSDREEPVIFYKDETIDSHFIKRNFLNINKIHLERDSDNIILYSMTNDRDRIEVGLITALKDKLQAIINMSQSILVNELQKIYFYNAYKLHSDELCNEWLVVERDSLLIVAEVLNSIKTESIIKAKSLRSLLGPILPVWFKNLLRRIYWKMRGVKGLISSAFLRQS